MDAAFGSGSTGEMSWAGAEGEGSGARVTCADGCGDGARAGKRPAVTASGSPVTGITPDRTPRKRKQTNSSTAENSLNFKRSPPFWRMGNAVTHIMYQ